MIRLAAAEARLENRVPQLKGRIGTAGQFSALVERNQVPQHTPAAFLLLGGLKGGAADAAAGLFRQAVREMLLVVLFVRHAGDATGAKALDEVAPLVRAVIEALVGWGPEDCPGVYVLDSASIVSIAQGTIAFEVGLALDDQLRIAA